LHRISTILALALPIVGGMVSQNVLNLVDTAMVGSLGDIALAGTGMGGFANFMAVSLLIGFSAGVQAMVSRRIGAGDTKNLAEPLHAALFWAFIAGVILTVVYVSLTPILFPYLHPDPQVSSIGVPYLQARLLGLTAAGFNMSFRGYWNGISKPSLYFRTLVFMHAINIFLNWVLIFGHLGVDAYGPTGAGMASAIATWCGAIFYFFQASYISKAHGFFRIWPSRAIQKRVLALSIPNSIQTLFFSSGMMTLFWIIGRVGTAETAAANVLINLMLVAILPGIAFGMSAATLSGQALGRKDNDDAYQWGLDVSKVAICLMSSIGLFMVLFPHFILSGFLSAPSTILLAQIPLQIFGATIFVDGIGVVFQHGLMGVGATKTSMKVVISLQWGLFLPAAYIIGPVMGFGLMGIWIMHAFYRTCQAAIFGIIWRRRNWMTISV
jgi:multidrug resistance protein, MATE family